MDHDILLLVAQAVMRSQVAIRKGRIEDADRWSRIADRYATMLVKIEKGRASLTVRPVKPGPPIHIPDARR